MEGEWKFLDPNYFSQKAFGLTSIWAIKVKRHVGDSDVRVVELEGDWKIVAEMLMFDPIKEEELEESEWFIFAAIGEES
jgi:hypothetical protein